ncbi:MAG TPA: aminoacetone oxidase family FAD-binding enzyme [Vicinamibacterales bacterium]|nr:aminoacetone oxidase family FAD-binding enzyme [Vicinamibacterales bacterium]
MAAPSVAVVGAGAAGLVAAAFAAAGGAAVTLIERTKDGGRKILISGGGRCNVLPSVLAPERFVSDSPVHLLRGMLRAWPLHEQHAFFERDLGIPLALEEESGKLFPKSDRARDIRDALVEFARTKGARLHFNTTVTGVVPSASGFRLETSSGNVDCTRVVLATGGLSVPATGSDGIGLRIAATLGHQLNDTYPALTPLLDDTGRHAALSGISLNVRLRSKSVETHGGFLFTHRGYSGPSVLDISHVTSRPAEAFGEGGPIRVQWASLGPEELTGKDEFLTSILSRKIPSRLAEQLLHECSIPLDRRTSSLTREERHTLIEAMTSYALPWSGNEGYKKAEVTGGGVALTEVNPKTLESRKVKGLYLCGEMLDAFGPIGGHNFSWAWSTGRAAGMAAGSAP